MSKKVSSVFESAIKALKLIKNTTEDNTADAVVFCVSSDGKCHSPSMHGNLGSIFDLLALAVVEALVYTPEDAREETARIFCEHINEQLGEIADIEADINKVN